MRTIKTSPAAAGGLAKGFIVSKSLLVRAAALLALLVMAPLASAVDTSGATMISTSAINTTGTAKGTDYTAYPLLNNSAVPPLVMLVVSRDEQLFIKAYTDYTDLDGDGLIDTTYNNNFSYSGYFDPNLCYSYGGSVFKATAVANNHLCSSAFSGNFMNWVAMSRADVLRYVLFGGLRSTDTASTTILQRADIPNDLHAWAKVYTTTNGVAVSDVTPYSNTTITMCNSSPTALGAGDPVIRVASGSWSEWAATASNQCSWRENNNSTDNPTLASSKINELTARVQVCDPSVAATLRESFCALYTDSSTATPKLSYKPVGLLQRYGESGQMRFGLVTGSFNMPRSGGVLRRNIGRIAGNTTGTDCATGDEISLKDGHFCYLGSTGTPPDGVIDTLNALKLTQWSGGVWNDCNQYSILNRNVDSTSYWLLNPGMTSKTGNAMACSAWGNPLTEMYAEAVRYIAADSGGKTSAFNGASGDLTGLPSASWADPYKYAVSGNPYCAACSIIILSTGLNSFDSDEIPTMNVFGSDTAASATTAVGTLEKISGNYIVGRVGLTPLQTGTTAATGAIATYQDLCISQAVTDLSLVRGICPDIPSMEGSYLIAGIAYLARTKDVRPGLLTPDSTTRPPSCDAYGNNCVPYANTIKTYAVALSENLPKFQIPFAAGSSMTITPLCQANNSGSAAISSSGWRSCYLGSVGIGPKVSQYDARFIYGRPSQFDDTLGQVAGSFSLVWEDSLWGNDHDNDVVSMVTYCVGDACTRSTGLPVPASTTNKLCFYSNVNYGGTEYCPSSGTGDINTFNASSVKIPAGYTVQLYTGQGQSGNGNNTVTFTSTSANAADFTKQSRGNGNTWNDAAGSFSITGDLTQLPLNGTGYTAYTGYDICWESTATVCGTTGRPTVAANQVLIRDETLSAYAGNAMLTGYTTTGSSVEGPQRLVLRAGNDNGSVITASALPNSGWQTPSVVSYTVGTGTASQLQNPLYYAAKYGGFDDARDAAGNLIKQPCDATTTPACTTSNWDSVNNTTGAAGSDGLPDTYFPVRNPAQLSDRLSSVFNTILARAGSGTAAAVVANNAGGSGVTYSALYQAQVQNKAASQTVSWAGNLYAVFTDSNGYLRAAKAGSTALGSYADNPIIAYCTDATGASRFNTYTDPNAVPSDINTSSCAGASVTALPTLWSAQAELSSPTPDDPTTQRTYSAPATSTSKRYIFTWIDADHDGIVDAGEQVPFTYGNGGFAGAVDTCPTQAVPVPLIATGLTYRFLNTCKYIEARNLINWVRGKDSGFYSDASNAVSDDTNWRSRTITEGTVKTTYRLGDIVNSTPLAVAAPAEALDQIYNDSTYATFRTVYQQRRQMVYVGANDGMLHAFNGGFYNASNTVVNLQPSLCNTSGCTLNTAFTAHELGAEVWAYVPGNLLPHLRWLADPAYAHNFYVDGTPVAQDVKAWPDATCAVNTVYTTQCHPSGWGTILIVPFRFGGGAVQTVIERTTSGGTKVQNSFPAYVVLDVTNPEAPPVLLAELTNAQVLAGSSCATANLSVFTCTQLSSIISTYTSSVPTVPSFRTRSTTNPTPNKFFLLTGSGTNDNAGVGIAGNNARNTSSVPMSISAYDFADLIANTVNPTVIRFTAFAHATNAFAGDLISTDTDLDGLANSVYFGSSNGTGTSAFGGSLWAVDFKENSDPSTWTPRELLTDLNRPMLIRPTVSVTAAGQNQIYFGTGRALVKSDLSDTSRQIIGSVVDKSTSSLAFTTTMARLRNITGVSTVVTGTGATATTSITGAGTAITTEAGLSQDITTNYDGWYYNLDNTNASGSTIPAERVVSGQVLFAGALLTTTYLPGTDSCTDQGTGRLYGMNYATGTASSALSGLLGLVTNGTTGTSTVGKYASLGKGLPASPALHASGEPDPVLRACTQTSSGAVLCADVKDLQGTASGEVSWREPIDK